MGDEWAGTVPQVADDLVGEERDSGGKQGCDGAASFVRPPTKPPHQEPRTDQRDEQQLCKACAGFHHLVQKRVRPGGAVDPALDAQVHKPLPLELQPPGHVPATRVSR